MLVVFTCRLCNLTLTRLVILRPLENDLTSVILAVKMQVGFSLVSRIGSVLGFVTIAIGATLTTCRPSAWKLHDG